MPDERIRRAEERDVNAIVTLVHELAEYEDAPDECHLTADQLRTALFGESPALFAHVAVLDGAVVGCALWFKNFSTWLGTHGIYLEDLYVRPAARDKGLGKALLVTLAEECLVRGYARLEWLVLDWNSPAIDFYKLLGAIPIDDSTVYRLTGSALNQLTGLDARPAPYTE